MVCARVRAIMGPCRGGGGLGEGGATAHLQKVIFLSGIEVF